MNNGDARSNFRSELIARADDCGAIPDGFEKNAVVPASVKWTGNAFESCAVRRPSIHEIYRETEYRHATDLPVQRRFLNRRHPVRHEVVERVVGKVTASLFINTYVDEAELHDLADQHIPSVIGRTKVACFAFDLSGGNGISDAVRQTLNGIPDEKFLKPWKLHHDIIPVVEFALLKAGYVVFDPYLNRYTDWSLPRVWNAAARYDTSLIRDPFVD